MKTGDIVRTPYDPCGIVEILSIDCPAETDIYGRVTCTVLYLHDHYGYAAGTKGLYELADMRPLGITEQRDFDLLWKSFKQANDLQLAIAKFLAKYALKEVT